MSADYRDLLQFWFEPDTRARWFVSTPEFDETLRARYAALVDEAGEGALQAWEEDAEGALALCILLDQLPRNIYRGTPRAFALDPQARAVADRALAREHDGAVPESQRLFFYLPFEHSENLMDQRRSVELFQALGDPELLDYAQRHREIVERFGRFPHRNEILGRRSTAEELEFLKEPGSSF